MTFQYDETKNQSNIKKHSVTFDEAFSSIHDPDAIWFYDETHSTTEDRYISIGAESKNRILFTVFTMRDDKYRIISSRKATRTERELYEGGGQQ